MARERGIFRAELLDLLRRLVFEQLEVFLAQAGHHAAHGIGDGDVDEHHLDVDADDGAASAALGLSGRLLGAGLELDGGRTDVWCLDLGGLDRIGFSGAAEGEKPNGEQERS